MARSAGHYVASVLDWKPQRFLQTSTERMRTGSLGQIDRQENIQRQNVLENVVADYLRLGGKYQTLHLH